MSSVEQFAAMGNALENLPSPFREALSQRISTQERVRHLVHSPVFATDKFRYLASVLCVTDMQWFIVLSQKDGSATINQSSYDRTLFVELTIILLHGQLRIDFVLDGKARSAACQFNTVMERAYVKAIQDILNAIDGNGQPGEKLQWLGYSRD
jgi:hypothetical protein